MKKEKRISAGSVECRVYDLRAEMKKMSPRGRMVVIDDLLEGYCRRCMSAVFQCPCDKDR